MAKNFSWKNYNTRGVGQHLDNILLYDIINKHYTTNKYSTTNVSDQNFFYNPYKGYGSITYQIYGFLESFVKYCFDVQMRGSKIWKILRDDLLKYWNKNEIFPNNIDIDYIINIMSNYLNKPIVKNIYAIQPKPELYNVQTVQWGDNYYATSTQANTF